MRRIIFLLFFACFIFSANANVDSLRQAYQLEKNPQAKLDIGIQLFQQLKVERKLDSAILVANESIDLAKNNDASDKQFEILFQLSELYDLTSQLNRADSILNLTLDLSVPDSLIAKAYIQKYSISTRKGLIEETYANLAKARELLANDTLGNIMAMYYCNLAVFYNYKSEVLKALDLFKRGKKVVSTDHKYYPRINHNLSRIYEQIGLFAEAKPIFQENFDFAEKSGDRLTQLFALYGIGAMNLNLKDYEGVKKTCYQAIDFKEQYGVSQYFGYNHILLSGAFIEEGKLDSALATIREGIRISEVQQEDNEALLCKFLLAQVFQKMEQIDSAYYYAEEAKVVINRFDSRDKQKIANIYAEVGDHETAYRFVLDAHNLELEKSSNAFQIISSLLDVQYRQEKIDAENRFQQRLNEQLRKQQIAAIIIIAIIFLLGLLLYAIIQSKNNKKLKQLNDSLSQRNEALKQFAYITSHDLKEPVRNISSFTQILQQNLKQESAENQKKYLDFIDTSSKTLHEIVNAIQTFTDVQFENVVKDKVDLNTVFSKLETSFSPKIEEQNASLKFINVSNIKQVLFSEPMLVLILQNLIKNGFKFNDSDQPKVSVEVTKNLEKTIFSVKDNGIGIEKKYHTSIFEPFKTLANKSTTNSSGLGLSICKNIIENYGGRIWIESNENGGSTFYFEV